MSGVTGATKPTRVPRNRRLQRERAAAGLSPQGAVCYANPGRNSCGRVPFRLRHWHRRLGVFGAAQTHSVPESGSTRSRPDRLCLECRERGNPGTMSNNAGAPHDRPELRYFWPPAGEKRRPCAYRNPKSVSCFPPPKDCHSRPIAGASDGRAGARVPQQVTQPSPSCFVRHRRVMLRRTAWGEEGKDQCRPSTRLKTTYPTRHWRRLAWRPQERGRSSAPAAFNAVRSLGTMAIYFAVPDSCLLRLGSTKQNQTG